MMTKQDYLGWREHPATREFMEVVVNELNIIVENLIDHAGDNPLQDKYRRGQIEGLKWLIDWVPTVQEETEDDEDGIASAGTSDSY